MLQEVKHGLQSPGAHTLPEYERGTKNKKISYKVNVLETPPPITIYNRAGLKFPEDASFTSPLENILGFNVCLLKYFAWLFCWWLSSNGDQRVLSIGGFIWSTGSGPEKETTIDYYKTLHQPITQYETVQKLLQQSEEATNRSRPKICDKNLQSSGMYGSPSIDTDISRQIQRACCNSGSFSYRGKLHWDAH